MPSSKGAERQETAQGEAGGAVIHSEAYNGNPALVSIEYQEALQNLNWAIFGTDGGAYPILPLPSVRQDGITTSAPIAFTGTHSDADRR